MLLEAQMESTRQESVARVQTLIREAEERKSLAVEAGMTGYDLGFVDGQLSALRILEELGRETAKP